MPVLFALVVWALFLTVIHALRPLDAFTLLVMLVAGLLYTLALHLAGGEP